MHTIFGCCLSNLTQYIVFVNHILKIERKKNYSKRAVIVPAKKLSKGHNISWIVTECDLFCTHTTYIIVLTKYDSCVLDLWWKEQTIFYCE